MALKRYHRVFLISLLGVSLLFWVALKFFLPWFIETTLLPKMAKNAGISSFSCQIRKLNLTGIDIGQIQVGRGISVNSVRVDYGIIDLFHRHVQQISVVGAIGRFSFENGKVIMDGIDFSRSAGAEMSANHPETSGKVFPLTMVSLDRVSIQNSVVELLWNGNRLRVPFCLESVGSGDGKDAYRYLVNSYVRGQLLQVAGELDIIDGDVSAILSGNGIRLEYFSDMVPAAADLPFKCAADIKLAVHGNLPHIHDISGSLAFHHPVVWADGSTFGTAISDKAAPPIGLTFATKDLQSWQFAVTQASVGLPLGNLFAEAKGDVLLETSSLKIDGAVNTRFEPIQKDGLAGDRLSDVRITGAPSMAFEFHGNKSDTGQWQVSLASETKFSHDHTDQWQAAKKDVTIQFARPQMLASVSSDGTGIYHNFSVKLSGVKVTKEKNRLQWSHVTLTGETRSSEKSATSELVFSGTALDGDIKTNGGRGKIPRLSVTGSLLQDKSNKRTINSRLAISKGTLLFRSKSKTARISDISADVPFHWPYATAPSPGHLRAGSITWGQRNMGSLDGVVSQENIGFKFKGRYRSKFFKNMTVKLAAVADPFSQVIPANINIHLPPYQLPSGFTLDQLTDAASGVALSGEISAEADIRFTKYSKSGSLRARFQDGRLAYETKDMHLDGITVDIAMPRVFDIKSAPKQPLHIETLSFGELHAADMAVEFQVESPQSLFIEQSRFKWCDGYIQTQPIRIKPGINEYNLTFNCDRLKLSCLLDQFGVATAAGQGTVNGRVPVRITNREITFQDGFLYSTPGGGGHIELTGAELLTAGLPPDTPQYVQMDIAQEALKNFEYQWVKLNLSTEEKNLKMSLQFDGKPTGVLPFEYKKEIGGFARVDATSKGSSFQGIRLDVNFTLPLDELLQYKEIIKNIK